MGKNDKSKYAENSNPRCDKCNKSIQRAKLRSIQNMSVCQDCARTLKEGFRDRSPADEEYYLALRKHRQL